jgi:tRNA A22 N-methylase
MTPRHRKIVEMVPRGGFIVDVGADHAWVAREVEAVAVERHPHRRAGPARWVVADGLAPFREVDTAIIAGMGARKIVKILEGHCRPRTLVLAPQDDPGVLRVWLADHGWSIDAEALAPEAGDFAEVLRAVAGTEQASGLELFFGPRLLSGEDPLRSAWWDHRFRHWDQVARHAPAGSLAHRVAMERRSFLLTWRDGQPPVAVIPDTNGATR